MCRRQRSKLRRLAESPKILTEFLYTVMDRNLTFCQKCLKSELAHLRETTRLRKRQALLLEQRQRNFLL